LWDRQLPHYPNTGPRMLYLSITVAVKRPEFGAHLVM